LWIQGLQDKDNNTIYVPTEAGLPILEAGKRQDMKKGKEDEESTN
jgi:hypothetical protein